MPKYSLRSRVVAGLATTALICANAPAIAQRAIDAAAAGPSAPAAAPTTTNPTLCGQPVPQPVNQPPTDMGPVLFVVSLCFEKQGGTSVVDPQTYLYYIQTQPSLPSQNIWKPWNSQAEQTVLEDGRRLWATGFLDDYSIEIADFHFSNGVIGKMVTFQLEERQRIKNVTFVGADGKPFDKDGLNRTKFEEKLRGLSITIRPDSFVDPATQSKVANAVREMLVDKGYQDAKVEPIIEPRPDSPKTVDLSFKITEGPKVKIADVVFTGNKTFSDDDLKGRMKRNKGKGFFLFKEDGVYQADRFEEDADRIVAFYLEHGYIDATVGKPSLKKLRDSKDGKERLMVLEVPITEGPRYRVGDLKLEGNVKCPATTLRPYLKLKPGEYYDEKEVEEAFRKWGELYGEAGFIEMTPRREFERVSLPATEPKVNLTLRLIEGK